MSYDSAPPAKSGSGVKVVLIVLGIIALLGLLACGGIIALGYLGFTKGMEAAGQEFARPFEGNPALVAEVGEPFTFSMDIMEVGRRAEQNPGKQILVFNVEGPNGKGVLIGEPVPGTNNRLTNVKFETTDGRTVDIPVEESDGFGGSFDPSDIDPGTIEDMESDETVETVEDGNATE